jgi:hypothetical protein
MATNVFEEGYLETIVNVNFGDALWIAIYVEISTANNSQPATGSCTATIGGTPFNLFGTTDSTNFPLTPQALAENDVGAFHWFEQTLGDDFSDSTQAWLLVNATKLLSTLGPGVPILGQVILTGDNPLNSGFIGAGLSHGSDLEGSVVQLFVDALGFPPGLQRDEEAGFATASFELEEFSATLNFQVDVQAETIEQT